MTIAPGSYPVPAGSTLIVPGTPPPPTTKSPAVPTGTQIPGGNPVKTFDFTQGKLPPEFVPGWFKDGVVQNNTKMLAANVGFGPDGLALTYNKAANTGGLISSNPSDGYPGRVGSGYQIVPTAADPVFVQWTHRNMSAAAISNWLADWLTGQNWPMTGEIDPMELFGGQPQQHLEYGPDPQHVSNPGLTGAAKWQPGNHTVGVYWQPGMAEFFIDGLPIPGGNVLKAPGYLASPLYIVVENSGGSPPTDSVFTTAEIDVWNGPIVLAP